MENIFTIYGASLKAARMAVKPKVTQEKMAGYLGMERSTYTQWEAKGTIEIEENTLNIIKKVLNVDTNVLTKKPDLNDASGDILDHPIIKSLVEQSKFILKRAQELEDENKRLKDLLKG